MDKNSPWIKHGALNTFEHGITRVADALTTLTLLWALAPEIFSKLALSQAIVAPLLFFFIAPETVIYRDYSKWKEKGPVALASRIWAFRTFGYGKAQLAILISLIVAFLTSKTPFSSEWSAYSETFWGLIWAFSLALGPQIAGADREYLRISLQLETLSLLTFYQKIVLFLGTLAMVFFFPGMVAPLAGVAVFSMASTAFAARMLVNESLISQGATSDSIRGKEGPGIVVILSESLVGFSFWQHLQGIILNWVQTMDLFCMGLFAFPARQIGLYAAVLKLANFTTFIPLALSNGFGIWVARRLPEQGVERERKELLKYSLLLSLGVVVQAGIFLVLAPYFISILSHGRWSPEEQGQMVGWFKWVLLGAALLYASILFYQWLQVRTSAAKLFRLVYLPWGALAFAVYAFAASTTAPTADPTLLAQMNGVVGVIYCALIVLYYSKVKNH